MKRRSFIKNYPPVISLLFGALLAHYGASANAQDGDSSVTSPQQIAGVVMHLTGKWRCNGSKILAIGDSIIDGSKIERVSKEGSITIILVDGKKLVVPDSQKSEPIIVRKTKIHQKGWLLMALEMFSKRSGDWIVAESRGIAFDGQPLKLSDAVVTAEAGQIDINPAIQQAPEGKYTLEFSRVSGTGNSQLSEEIILQKSSPLTIQEEKLPAGLYKMRLTEKSAAARTRDALLLVCTNNDFDKKLALFSKATEEANELDSKWSALERRQLLRAYLGYLNASK